MRGFCVILTDMMSKLLLLEDDLSLVTALSFVFKKQGDELEVARTIREADALWSESKYDLLVLDVSLPDGTGFAFCEKVRQVSKVPIMFLTASDEEMNVIMGLNLGADDYITKPFGSAELLARIRTSLRHSTRMNTSSDQLFHPYKCGELILDFEKRTLTISGNIVHLTPISFQITYFLIK